VNYLSNTQIFISLIITVFSLLVIGILINRNKHKKPDFIIIKPKTKISTKYILISLFVIIVIFFAFSLFIIFRPYNGELIAIKETNLYHKDSCEFVKKSSINSLIFFKDLYELSKVSYKQYRPCKTCNPPLPSKEILKKIEDQKITDQERKDKPLNSGLSLGEKILEQRRKKLEQPDEVISKLIISGNSHELNYGTHKITCTVKNDNLEAYDVGVKAIYYNSKKEAILTSDSQISPIRPNDIQGFTISNYENVSSISSYELKIILK